MDEEDILKNTEHLFDCRSIFVVGVIVVVSQWQHQCSWCLSDSVTFAAFSL